MMHRALIVLLGLLLASPGRAEVNLLANPGGEEVDGQGRPVAWDGGGYRTAGKFEPRDDGGHGGRRYFALIGATETDRSAWRQKVAVPEGTRAVAFGGWYRTRGLAGQEGRGASLRILFHRSSTRWDEIGLKQAFYPPSETWARAEGAFRLPEGTTAVVIELFHWLTPGETHWDDVFIRPVPVDEVPAMPLPPDLAVDREPVFGRNLPYHPADGDRVGLNPPPFRWLPSGKVTYRLEIAPTADLSGDAAIRFDGLTACARMLTHALKPGIWHWRYGVDREGEATVWSKVRRFEVPADAAAWPYPGRETFRVADQHPRLYFPAERLADYRRRAREGDLKPEADALLASVKRIIGAPLPAEPPFLPADDKNKAAWEFTRIMRETRPPMDQMANAALAWLLTGDQEAGAEAKRRVLHFFAWDPHGSTRIFHNDEPAMWLMRHGTRAYDWTYDLYTPEERTRIESSLKARAEDMHRLLRNMPFENNPYSSHPGRDIGFLGEAALAFLKEWPEAIDWLDYVMTIWWGVYPAWGQDDGGWNEGPGYWGAYQSFALEFVVPLREATGIDLARRPFFRNTPYYRLYLTPPYSQMSPFGDGTQFKPNRPGNLIYWFSTLTRDPALRWYAEAMGAGPGSSAPGMVLKDPTLQARAPVELPQARLFDGIGLATLHTHLVDGDRNVMFALRSSPYGAVSHGHNDQNCFVLEAFGEPLAIASGYYPRYGSPHHDQWTRSTKAKCGITYDGGQGQDRGWQAQGAITSFVHGDAFDLVVGDATKAYGGRLTRAVRQVVHVRPGLFVIRDDLAAPEPRRFEYQLHALDQMTVDQTARTVTTKRPKATLRTEFLAPERLDFRQTDRYEPEPETVLGGTYENTWHLTAALPEAHREAEFVTVLAPAKVTDEALRPTSRRLTGTGGNGVELSWGDGRQVVIAFGARKLGGIETDGAVAAVSLDARRQVVGWLLDGGTTLRYGGQPLGSATPATTVTLARSGGDARLDTSGPAATVRWSEPAKVRSITSDGRAVQQSGDGVKVAAGRRTFLLWSGAPLTAGEFEALVKIGDRTVQVPGRRFGLGEVAVQGVVEVPAGAWRAQVPDNLTLKLGYRANDGLLWATGRQEVLISGRGSADGTVLSAALSGITLPARPLSELPAGTVFEAEQGYREQLGAVQVSGGKHAGVSGGDNLWSWNTAGSDLTWSLDVPRAGRYHLWLVGATETGLLAELRVDAQPALALQFAPTGGWGRKNADEWRAFQVARADGKPLELRLSAGRHELMLGNRSGLGLNLDRLVLVPVP